MVQQLSLAILAPLRVNVSVNYKQIYPTVVVIVKKLSPPAYVRKTHLCDFCPERNIRKRIAPIIAVKDVVFVVEVGYEQVKLSVMIVITQGSPHATLLTPALVYRSSGNKCDIFGSPVTVVMVEEVWRRVIGRKDI